MMICAPAGQKRKLRVANQQLRSKLNRRRGIGKIYNNSVNQIKILIFDVQMIAYLTV